MSILGESILKKPLKNMECFYCQDLHNSDHFFMKRSVCFYCESEIAEYFKKLCASKKQFRVNKISKTSPL